MRDLGDNIELWIAGGIAIALAVLLVWAFKADMREQREWQEFATTHNCRVVSRANGETYTTVTPMVDGKGNITTNVGVAVAPDRVGYACDDGVTYYRDE